MTLVFLGVVAVYAVTCLFVWSLAVMAADSDS